MALKEVDSIVERAKKSKDKSETVKLAVSNAKEQVSKDVRQLSENKWQITGKSVEEIKALYDNIDVVKERAIQMVKEAHTEMWELINRKCGTKKEDHLHIDADHMKEGLIILERNNEKKKGDGMPEGMAEIIKAMILSKITE